MRTLALTAAAATMFAGAASAATISFTVPFNIPIASVPGGGSINLPAFNGNLGTLLSATFDITGTVGTSGTFTNTSASGTANVTLVQTAFIAATGPATLSLNAFASPADSDGPFVIGPGGIQPYSVSYSTSNSGPITDLAGVTTAGPGTFSVTYFLSSSVAPTGSGASNGALTFASSGSFVGEMSYTYEAPDNVIPLPAALPLLATAIGVIGVARLRRKA